MSQAELTSCVYQPVYQPSLQHGEEMPSMHAVRITLSMISTPTTVAVITPMNTLAITILTTLMTKVMTTQGCGVGVLQISRAHQ